MPSGTPTTLTGFTVKLGASGLGTVAPQVKLPLAVTFYSLAHHSVPTPYVGILDLEKALANSRLPGHYALPKAGHVQVRSTRFLFSTFPKFALVSQLA